MRGSHSVILERIGDRRYEGGRLRTRVSLSDGAHTLTTDQLINRGIFTITPTAARTLTTATAASIIAALDDSSVGTSFEFTIVNLASATYAVTLAGGTGVTIVGAAAVAAATSGTFKAVVASSTAVSIYRM